MSSWPDWTEHCSEETRSPRWDLYVEENRLYRTGGEAGKKDSWELVFVYGPWVIVCLDSDYATPYCITHTCTNDEGADTHGESACGCGDNIPNSVLVPYKLLSMGEGG